jgi:hypothetical protein
VSNSSDPERGGQQPDERSREGQPGGAAGQPPGGQFPGWSQQPSPPGQYQPGQYPQPGSQPGQYSPYAQPGQYAQPGPGQYDPYQVPSHGQPYGDRGGYVYSPYGSSPAGMQDHDDRPVSRPGIMVLALVLLILSTIPALLTGLALVLAPEQAVQLLTPQDLAQFEQAQVAPATALALGGWISLIGVLLFVLFAVLAFTGRNWARIVVAIMTAGFALLMVAVFGLTGGTSDGIVALLMVGASIAGTVILFLPATNRYFASARR